MTREEAFEALKEMNPDALLADGFEEAFIGVARQFNRSIAAYDYDRCVEILMNEGMTDEQAVEHMEVNVVGSWVGQYTPIFCSVARDESS